MIGRTVIFNPTDITVITDTERQIEMRINAQSKITSDDVHVAVHQAHFDHGQDIYLDEITTGPKGAINFHCASVNGKYSVGRNDPQGKKAASWSAWGYVIAHLFNIDPDAHIGTYRGRDHFIRVIYGEQRRYIIRQSLGGTREAGPGSDCSFLSLFDSDLLEARYNETR